jgi:hypothetical protein
MNLFRPYLQMGDDYLSGPSEVQREKEEEVERL